MTSELENAAVSVRDIPMSGLVVRLAIYDPSARQDVALNLEPGEAAELARQLVQAADDAMHASRSKRRVMSEGALLPDAPLGAIEWCDEVSVWQGGQPVERCQKVLGHGGFHVRSDGRVFS